MKGRFGPRPPTEPRAHAQRIAIQLDHLRDEHGAWAIRPGQLVIVDEASMAGTLALDRIVTDARQANAKVLLVGDWAQLGAIEAGGAFAMLTRDRPDTPELAEVHRFVEEWERAASTRLRLGDPRAIDDYIRHDRIRAGGSDDMLDQLYEAWRADTERGLESLMITSDSASAAVLNNRAHSEAVALGHVIGPIVTIADGTAGVGDRIVTRRNDRIINAGHTWVRNGDTWTVTAAATNGSIRARRDSDYAEVVLPADYVAEHVDLAYATTAYRVQGRTVDSAHALVRSTSSRETLYVGATRGRIGNTLYVDIEAGSDVASGHGQAAATAEHVLGQALHHIGSDAAAHTVRETESEPAPFLRQQANLATLPTPAPPPAEPTSSLPEI